LCHHTLQVVIHKLDLSKTKTALLILITKSLDENTNSPNSFPRNQKYKFHKSPLHGIFWFIHDLHPNMAIKLQFLFCFVSPIFFNSGEHWKLVLYMYLLLLYCGIWWKIEFLIAHLQWYILYINNYDLCFPFWIYVR
jgi:hypothetical protein